MDQSKGQGATPVVDTVADYIVVGAGISGSFVAGQLAERGFSVKLVDKARGTGGRLSSKRLSLGKAQLSYDLGAQKFEASSREFCNYIETRDDLVFDAPAEEHAAGVRRAYAKQRNSLLARGALGKAEGMFGYRVLSANFNEKQWTLSIENKDGVSDIFCRHLILATPPKQAADILGSSHDQYQTLSNVEHEAQWVAMFAFKEVEQGSGEKSVPTLATAFSRDHFSALERRVAESKLLKTVALDNAKQGRDVSSGYDVVLAHASHSWTMSHLDEEKSVIEQHLASELASVLGLDEAAFNDLLEGSHIHRWLYSRPNKEYAVSGEFKMLKEENLLICGDYFTVDSDYGVESAFLSANALLRALS